MKFSFTKMPLPHGRNLGNFPHSLLLLGSILVFLKITVRKITVKIFSRREKSGEKALFLPVI
jgi:hypothetical protein